MSFNYKLWNFKDIEQEFTSEHTSINSSLMPKTIKKIEPLLIKGQRWADIGGGKFNNIQEHLAVIGEVYALDHPEIVEQYKVVFAYFEQGKSLLAGLRDEY